MIENELQKRQIARVSYFHTPEIQTMTALIRNSSLVITPDTSIVHLASAEAKPIIAFYLAVSEWLPYKINSYIVLPRKGEAISTIPLDIVREAVNTMLSKNYSDDRYTTRIVHCENPLSVEIIKS